MTNFLIKPERDVDYYISWSSFSDAPVGWGSRAMLEGKSHIKAEGVDFDRADKLGSSSFVHTGRWQDEEIVYMHLGHVRREDVRAFVEALDVAGDNPAEVHAQYLILTFDDDFDYDYQP